LFSKIKSEIKFAKSGEGQRLDEPSSSSSGSQTGKINHLDNKQGLQVRISLISDKISHDNL